MEVFDKITEYVREAVSAFHLQTQQVDEALSRIRLAAILPRDQWSGDAFKRDAQVRQLMKRAAREALKPKGPIPKALGDDVSSWDLDDERTWDALANRKWKFYHRSKFGRPPRPDYVRPERDVLTYLLMCKYLHGKQTATIAEDFGLFELHDNPERQLREYRQLGEQRIARWILNSDVQIFEFASASIGADELNDGKSADPEFLERHLAALLELVGRSAIQDDGKAVLSFAKHLCEFLERSQRLDDFFFVAAKAMEAAGRLGDVRSQLLHAAHLGWFYYRRGDFRSGETLLRKTLNLPDAHNFSHECALASRTLALALMFQGKLVEAEKAAKEALDLWTADGESSSRDGAKWIARAHGTRGLIALRLNKLAEAEVYLTSAVLVNHTVSEEGWVMNTVDIAEMRRQQGNLAEAQKLLNDAYDRTKDARDQDRYAYVLVHRARLAASMARAELGQAIEDLNTAATLYKMIDHRYFDREIADLSRDLERIARELKPVAVPFVPKPEDAKAAPGPFQDALRALLETHEAAEPLRKGSPRRYLAQTPRVFAAVSAGADGDAPAPLCVQFEITNRCSTECKMCFRYAWEKHSKRQELPTSRIEELISEFAAIGVESLVLSGGEPVIHTDFVRILKLARDVGLHVGILSNGIWPDHSVCDEIVQSADWVRLSVDGGTPESYARIRTPMPGFQGGLETVEQTLRSLSEAKHRHGAACQLGISYTIQKANVECVPEMIQFAERCEALQQESDPVVVFKLAHGHGPSFLCDVNQLRHFEETVLNNPRLLGNRRVDLRYMKVFFDRMQKQNLAAGRPLKDYYKIADFTCFTPYLFSLIDAFGDIYVCCHHYDDNGTLNSPERPKHLLGSVAEQGFLTVWKSDAYQQMRLRLKHIDVEGMPACGECTRHYMPNTAMSQLFNIVYAPLVAKHGKHEGPRIFENIVSAYPRETVWF